MARRRPPGGLQPRAVAPGSTATPLPPQKTRQHGWLGRGLVRGFAMLVVTLGLGLTFVSGQEQTAAAVGPDVACMITPDYQGRGPEQPGGGGPETLFGPMVTASTAAADAAAGPNSKAAFDNFTSEKGIDWDDPDSYTLYESNGVRGATWSTTEWFQQDDFTEVNGDEDEKRCNLTDSILTAVAQLVFDMDRTITSATIALRQTATDATPFINMIRDMSDEIGVMTTEVWVVGIGIAVMCSGFWVMSKWGGRNQREIVRGLIWVVCSIIGVGFLLFPSSASSGDPNYIWVAESANETTSQFIEDLGDALLPQDGDDGPCSLREGAEDRGTRMLDCGIYETLVFDPWSQGQYGGLGTEAIPYKDLPNGKTDKDLKDGIDIRQAQIRAQSVSVNEAYGGADWSLGKDDGDEFNPETKYGQWNLIRAEMWEHHNSDYKYWKGEEGSARISAAFSGLIASILVGIFVCATSLLTMIWNAVPVVLLIALPLVGTISVFPPMQKFLRGWAQTWLKATILGVLFGVAQMLALVMVGGVMSSGASLGWKCLMMIVMVLALWKVVQAAREDAFTPNLGAEGATMLDGDQMGRGAIATARTAQRRARTAGRAVDRTRRQVDDRFGSGARKRREQGRAEQAQQREDRTVARMRKDHLKEHGRDMTPEEVAAAKRELRHAATAPKASPLDRRGRAQRRPAPSDSTQPRLTGQVSGGRVDLSTTKTSARVPKTGVPERKPRRGGSSRD